MYQTKIMSQINSDDITEAMPGVEVANMNPSVYGGLALRGKSYLDVIKGEDNMLVNAD